MADHKSAIKRHKQAQKRTLRNSHYKSSVKTAMKKALNAVEEKSSEADELLGKAISAVDKVAAKGILPKNRAGHYVSRLTRLLESRKSK
ncbi:MAG: 30S ribosomal protein S20 [Deltaproteobacteria bacterium]|nr:30S ribosomal protein S20 [Deltaproteobacteria bacterium]